MRNPHREHAGFTVVETLIAIFILILIGSIGISVFYNSRSTKTLDVVTDGLNFTLELARSDALAGKNASNFGIFVATSSYTYFMGSSYDSSDLNNKTTKIPSGWLLSTSTANGSSAIVFTHLTGNPQSMATVTISNIATPPLKRDLVIGSQGDISVIK
ncbi:MAG: hypothetical protein NT077_01855 [Candidatus Taylorbacteria bacterium]|nr:hypothetical protein [Candidatus Taylorbacteria bacterium]